MRESKAKAKPKAPPREPCVVIFFATKVSESAERASRRSASRLSSSDRSSRAKAPDGIAQLQNLLNDFRHKEACLVVGWLNQKITPAADGGDGGEGRGLESGGRGRACHH